MNLAQSKLIEKILMNYIPREERQTPEFESMRTKSRLLIEMPEQTPVKEQSRQSAIDLVLHLSIDNQESLIRGLGYRVDRVNHMTYHLRDNVPPVDNAPLLERIQKQF